MMRNKYHLSLYIRSIGPKVVAALALLICSAGVLSAQQLQITTTSLPGGVVNTAYAPQVITASGGVTPYFWSISSGTLPPGLTFPAGASTSGVISGTPTTAGTFNFVVSATDSTGGTPQTAQRSLSIVVSPPLTIDAVTLPEGRVSIAYPPQALTATGGTAPHFWSVISGVLPSGLTLSSGGVISGTPSLSGRFNFTVRATDSSNPTQTATRALSIAVPPSITTASLPNGAVGIAYSAVTLTATAGSSAYTWSVLSGSLPAGLTLSSDGVLSGTPTLAGTFDVTIGISDGSTPALSGSRVLTIVVQPVLGITSPSELPFAVANAFYSRQLTTSGPSPVTWSVLSGSLPPGLGLTSSGSVSGVPAVAGTFNFVAQASGGVPQQTASRAFIIVVNPPLTITTLGVLPDATLSASYAAALIASGSVAPYSWVVSGGQLPPGLSLTTGGVLQGTPTALGNFTFVAQVSDSYSPSQSASRTFSVTVGNRIAITTLTLPNGAVGTRYVAQSLSVSAGTAPYTWSVVSGSLPQGLSLSTDGVISGTPEVTGTFDITFSVSDSSNPVQAISRVLSITIQPALAITTTSSQLPVGVVGAFYSRQIQASGPSPLTWSVISGSLPPGVTLTSGGSLAGIPAVAGTFDFTIQAAGGEPRQTTSQSLRVVMNPALAISTPAALRDAVPSAFYAVSLVATGGQQPYTWTASGRLPPGLSLSTAGVLSGTPGTVGTFTFTVQVADSFTPKQEVSRNFTLTVSPNLSISLPSLPNAIQNMPYSQQLVTTGGTSPYTWLITGGALPAGLTLSAAGLLEGTPVAVGPASFTATVTDSRGNSTARDFTMVVDPPVSPLSVSGFPGTLNPTQPTDIELVLSAPHPSPLSGQLTMTFTSRAEVPGDDPMTQFSSGSRTVNFTIPANGTAAVFPSRLSLLTGTVAGTVRLTASIDNGPRDIAVATSEIVATAPKMIDVTAVRTAGGLDVYITGYAPARRVTSVEFTFDVKVGTTIQKVTLFRNVDADFTAWYSRPVSAAYGSSFSFVQSFAIQGGDASAIDSVTIRLTNAQGSSSSAAVRLQ